GIRGGPAAPNYTRFRARGEAPAPFAAGPVLGARSAAPSVTPAPRDVRRTRRPVPAAPSSRGGPPAPGAWRAAAAPWKGHLPRRPRASPGGSLRPPRGCPARRGTGRAGAWPRACGRARARASAPGRRRPARGGGTASRPRPAEQRAPASWLVRIATSGVGTESGPLELDRPAVELLRLGVSRLRTQEVPVVGQRGRDVGGTGREDPSLERDGGPEQRIRLAVPIELVENGSEVAQPEGGVRVLRPDGRLQHAERLRRRAVGPRDLLRAGDGARVASRGAGLAAAHRRDA